MIRAAILFFVFALLAFALGAIGIAGISMDIGKMLLVFLLVFAFASFLASIFTGKKPQLLP